MSPLPELKGTRALAFLAHGDRRSAGLIQPDSGASTSRLVSASTVASPDRRRASDANTQEGTGETHWAPSFFDTVKSDGSVRNPLSSRKATQISHDLLAQLDLDRIVEQSTKPTVAVSPPIEVESPAVDQYFANPRPAPAPAPAAPQHSDSPVVPSAQSTTIQSLLPAAFSLPSRRRSLEPSTPSPSRLATTSSPRPSTPSTSGRGPKSRPSTASSASGSSVTMSSGPSSSGESVYSTDELLTPPTPSIGLPPTSPKAQAALCLLPTLQQQDGMLPVRRPSLQASSGSNAALAASGQGQKRVSLSARLSTKPLSAKEERQALELSVGRKVLEAAGASETEIRLRARSVGHQVLKQREEEAKRGGKGGKNSVALGDYTGGVELSSKFSIG